MSNISIEALSPTGHTKLAFRDIRNVNVSLFLRNEWAKIGLLFLTTRIALILVGVACMAFIRPVVGQQYKHLNAPAELDMWYRWDAGFYLSIARYGYSWSGLHQPTADMVFLPLYPMTIRTVNAITTCRTLECNAVTGVLISNIAFFLAMCGLYILVKAKASEKVAWQAVWLLMIMPGGVFFSGLYAEPLFLMLSIFAFVALWQDRFYLAAALAGLAAITRPVGIVLTVVLLLYTWQHYRLRSIPKLLAAAFPLITFGSYTLAAGLVTNDLFSYFTAYHTVWHRSVISSPLQTLLAYFDGHGVAFWGWELSWMDLGFALLYLSLAIILLRQDLLMGMFALCAILVPMGSGNLTGMPRYGMVVFPFYLLIAQWANSRWKRIFVYATFIILLIAFTARFTTWHWLA